MYQYENNHVYEFLQQVVNHHGEKAVLFGRTPTPEGDKWTHLTYSEIKDLAEKMASELTLAGLERGDHVLLMAKSRPEYAIGFFGILLAGGVVVPMDVRLSLADQIHISVASDSKFIISIDEETSKNAANIAGTTIKQLNTATVLNSNYSHHTGMDFSHSSRRTDEISIIAYTSGTTSSPKGVMLRWSNLQFQINTISRLFKHKEDFRMLSVLPLHHMFEITAGFLMPFSQGSQIFYGNSVIPAQIISFISTLKIRNMLVVPLFLSALKKGIEGELKNSKAKSLWFKATFALAQFLPFKTLRRLLFFPLHKKFGGELIEMISGASALNPEVARFFEVLGISIYEGYGLTETSPVISGNHQYKSRAGTIGTALPGTELKLHPVTSEIMVKGPHVMVGYYKNPGATQDCLTSDGWFITGDVGELDKDSFIKIKGRNKDIIVLGSGKKVVPDEVEEHLKNVPIVQEVCVIGTTSDQGAMKGTEVVTAVIVQGQDVRVPQDQALEILVQASQKLSYYKRPSHFIFLDEPLPKTSTLKIKKALVKELIKQRNAE